MTTSRGTLEVGALPEPGGTSHLHVMKAAGSNPDLYFGDDFNYVLQRGPAYQQDPAYGVEIGTNDNNGGSQHVWRFDTDGSLTIPGNIQATTGHDITISSGSNDGGTAASIVLHGAGGEGGSDNTNPLSGNIEITAGVDGGYENDNLYPGMDIGNIKLRTSSYTGETVNEWKFDKDGLLTLPSGTNIGKYGGSEAESITASNNTTFGIIASGSTGSVAMAWSDPSGVTPPGVKGAAVIVNNPLASTTGTVQIATGLSGPPDFMPTNIWEFGDGGNLTLPNNSKIKTTDQPTGVRYTINTDSNGATPDWNNTSSVTITKPQDLNVGLSYQIRLDDGAGLLIVLTNLVDNNDGTITLSWNGNTTSPSASVWPFKLETTNYVAPATGITIEANSNNWNFNDEGDLNVPGDILGPMGNKVELSDNLVLSSFKSVKINANYDNEDPNKIWEFGANGQLTAAGDIVPDTDNTYNLGSPSRQWHHLYVSTGSIYLGNIKLSNEGGNLAVYNVNNAGAQNETQTVVKVVNSSPIENYVQDGGTANAVYDNLISFIECGGSARRGASETYDGGDSSTTSNSVIINGGGA